MSPGRVAKRGVASACHDEAINAKEEVSWSALDSTHQNHIDREGLRLNFE